MGRPRKYKQPNIEQASAEVEIPEQVSAEIEIPEEVVAEVTIPEESEEAYIDEVDTSNLFHNGTDPAHIMEVNPEDLIKPEVTESDDERTKQLKNWNITDEDIIFVKRIKENFNVNSDQSLRLWSLHLKIHGRYPSGDRFCGACLTKCLADIWEVIGDYYATYLINK